MFLDTIRDVCSFGYGFAFGVGGRRVSKKRYPKFCHKKDTMCRASKMPKKRVVTSEFEP